MRRPWIFPLSLGLNIILALVLLFHHRKTTPQTIVEVETVPATNPPSPRFIVRKQFFSWQELESPDYEGYVKNLRGVNCPEQTVSDIVVADVNQQFAYRRLTEVLSPAQQWWTSEPDSNLVAQSIEQKQTLEQTRRTLLNTLLGTNWLTANPPRNFQIFLTGPVLGDLSAEVKHAVLAILQRADHNTVLFENNQADQGIGADPRGDAIMLANLDRQTRKELSLVLTPEQLEEYLLRYSDSAAALRRDLPVQMTPDEFRQIFRSADALEQQLAVELVMAGQGDRKRYEALDAQLAAVIRNVLGPERYQAYLYQKDPIYRDVVDRVNDAGASADRVQALYNIEIASQNLRNQILGDTNLTDSQKQAQLDSLELRDKQASDQLLGLAPAITPPAPPVPPAPPAQYQVHQYSPGETIDQLAAQYGTTPAAILNANPDVNFNGLSRNQPIRIPKPQ
jgi:LysM repeat protein